MTYLTLAQRILWSLRKLRLHIKRDDLVLEVGSGGNPFFRADVLCDLAIGDDAERDRGLVLDRPFVLGRAEALPFRNQSFDYVVAIQLVEHLNEPAFFLEECMRVGRRGYIETPGEFGEKLSSLPMHKQFVRMENEELVLTPKTRPVFDEYLTRIFWSECLADWNFRRFLWHRRMFTVMYEWDRVIRYRIELLGEPVSASEYFERVSLESSEELANAMRKVKARQALNVPWPERLRLLYKGVLRILLSPRRTVDIWELLACPICKQPVSRNEATGFVVCPCLGDGRGFPVVEGIPLMIPEYVEDVHVHKMSLGKQGPWPV